jgi:hypothetical protein
VFYVVTADVKEIVVPSPVKAMLATMMLSEVSAVRRTRNAALTTHFHHPHFSHISHFSH